MVIEVRFEGWSSRWRDVIVWATIGAIVSVVLVIVAFKLAYDHPLVRSVRWVVPILMIGTVVVGVPTWRRRVRRRGRTFIREGADQPLKSLVQTAASAFSCEPQGWEGFEAMTHELASQGRVGETLRIYSGDAPAKIDPLGVPFEPVRLHQADAAFDELHRCSTPEPKEAMAKGFDTTANLADRLVGRWFARKVAADGGWVRFVTSRGWIVPFGLLLLVPGINREFRLLVVLMMSMWLVSLLMPSGRGLLFWTKQWFIVPGGIVVRRAPGLGLGRGWKVHLFAQRDSVLCVDQRSRQGLQTAVVADKDHREQFAITGVEMSLLLRAWLCPLSPPSEETLSDLH